MSETDERTELAPIIIVRRSSGHHDEHHGGVWKIAFADFMTAMMAFFLVMWLVNAANEETKAQVASYFNPIKLTDTRAIPKGIQGAEQQIGHEAEETDAGLSDDRNTKGKTEQGAIAKSEAETKEENAENKPFNEEALFKDPYAVLAEIAGDEGQGEPVPASVPRGGEEAGLNGGEAFRDPFDPTFWQHGPGVPVRKTAEPPQTDAKFDMNEVREVLGDSEADRPVATGQEVANLQTETGKTSERLPMSPPGKDGAEAIMSKVDAADPEAAMKQVQDAEPKPPPEEIRNRERADKVKSDLARIIGEAGLAAAGPQLSVEGTGEGVLVRLTDGNDFSMFALSSAKPQPEMVRLMEKVATALKQAKGRIIVRGHTDGRPFRSEHYDNWRLSTARAHMAYHMLVRGGVGKDRFVRIEGRADRDLKIKGNPAAAQNRRIEILIQDPAS